MKEKIKVLLPEAEVDKKIQELGEQISKDYEGKNIHMICVLKGGVFFTCELAKRISVPVSLDFMSVSSYVRHHQVPFVLSRIWMSRWKARMF